MFRLLALLLFACLAVACPRKTPEVLEDRRPPFPKSLLACEECPTELELKPIWQDFDIHRNPGPLKNACYFCQEGRRCVQSLFDPDWASLQDELGSELYRWTPATSWKRVARYSSAAFRSELPAAPPSDLLRWIKGDDSVSTGQVHAAVREYFGFAPPKEMSSAKERYGVRLTGLGRDGSIALYLSAGDGSTDVGTARVTSFGLPGCDGRPIDPRPAGAASQ